MTGDGIEKWRRDGERQERQSGEHLGTEDEWGGWIVGQVKRSECCAVLYRVTCWVSHVSSPDSRAWLSPSAYDRLRPFRTAENAHSFVICPFVSAIPRIV